MARPTKRRPPPDPKRAKRNLLKTLGIDTVISDKGKIRSRNVTGLTVQQQRQVAIAIKNAREMALLPYPGQRN
jgi:small subunit ribosomal protein S18